MRNAVFTILFLSLILAGCTDTPPAEPDEGLNRELRFYYDGRVGGIVINKTETPGEVYVHTYRFPGRCEAAGGYLVWSHLEWIVVDSSGSLTMDRVSTSDVGEQDFTIPLHGEGPWLLTGDRPGCTSERSNFAFGIEEGFNVSPQELHSRWEMRRVQNYTIPPGESSATFDMDLPPYTVGIGSLGLLDSGGGFRWNLTYHGPKGFYTSYESDGFDTDKIVADGQFWPGDYAVTIEREVPLLGDGTWEMWEWLFVISPEVCDHGIHLIDVC